MLDIGTCLRHYKQPHIQQAMVEAGKTRETAIRYGDKGYGKRPDMLHYPQDILELVKQGATSFHVSEERWANVYLLRPELKKEELAANRTGWDLVIDIDCPDFGLSRIFAWLVVTALREHGINSISAKFSGNKGFHIGVPFESFPVKVHDKETREQFPQGPRRIAAYLVDYLSEKHIKVNESSITFGNRFSYDISRVTDLTKKSLEEIAPHVCKSCRKQIRSLANKTVFQCTSCGASAKSEGSDYRTCDQCGKLMAKEIVKPSCDCGSRDFERRINPLMLTQVDTLLISSRHLYRMPYSLHEKSGLCSVVIDPAAILEFERDMGKPDQVTAVRRFLDTSATDPGEASELLIQAFDFQVPQAEDEREKKEWESLTEAIPEDLFPPCIKNIRAGIDDGKKRALFILVNFLQSTGYSLDKIEDILSKWNSNNREPLREVLIKGQLRYKKGQKAALPPNCNNPAYYKDIGVCTPDSLCRRIRNPANYSVLRAKMSKPAEGSKREKLTPEQKEMRRLHRQRQKEAALSGSKTPT